MIDLLPPGNPPIGAPYPGGGPPLLKGPIGGGGPKLKPPGGGPPPLSYAEVIWSMMFCALSWPSAVYPVRHKSEWNEMETDKRNSLVRS